MKSPATAAWGLFFKTRTRMGVDRYASAKGCERFVGGGVVGPGHALSDHAGRSEDQAAKTGRTRHALRYKFAAGESLRWKVVNRCRVRTTVSGTTKTAETVSTSTKLWRVTSVRADGSATFEHLVEWVDMRHQLTGDAEVHYNSRSDAVPPHGFEYLAQSVGVPLSIVTLDARGEVVKRTRLPVKAAVGGEGEMTVVLPKEPVAVGQEWSVPREIELPLPRGGVRKIKARDCFSLLGVKTGVATIRLATQIPLAGARSGGRGAVDPVRVGRHGAVRHRRGADPRSADDDR